MDVAGFCRQAHVVVVAGKGGVGKTTIAATLALAGAKAGLDVLVVALDDSGGLPGLFGFDGRLAYEDTVLAEPAGAFRTKGRVRGRVITSDEALLEYLRDHGLGRVAKRLVATGALDVIATAIPGIREVLVLGKLKQLERDRVADLIVVDAPATGHAMTFLTSSSGLVDAARGGPLRSQAEAVVALLSDAERCAVLLVTLPEETPVNELVEAAFRLEDEVGVKLGPIVVNACFPDRGHLDADPTLAAGAAGSSPGPAELHAVAAAAEFARARLALEREQLDRLAEQIALHQLRLPLLFSAATGPEELEHLSSSLADAIEAL